VEFDFAANETVDDLQLVPEQFRSVYIEKDGQHVIGDVFKPLTTVVGGLAKSLKASRAEAKAAKGSTVDLSPLSEFGSTPAEIAERFRSTTQTLNDQLAQKGNLDPEKVKAELRKGFDTELAAKDNQLKTMSGTLQRYLVDSAAATALAEYKGVPDLLLPHIRSQVKVVQNGETYNAIVVDSDGDARVSSVTGEPMTINDLVKEMRSSPVFGRAFESDAPSGGGLPPGPRAPVRASVITGKVLTSTDKIRIGLDAQKNQR